MIDIDKDVEALIEAEEERRRRPFTIAKNALTGLLALAKTPFRLLAKVLSFFNTLGWWVFWTFCMTIGAVIGGACTSSWYSPMFIILAMLSLTLCYILFEVWFEVWFDKEQQRTENKNGSAYV